MNCFIKCAAIKCTCAGAAVCGSASAAKNDERGRIGRHDHRYPVLHILLGTCAGFYPGIDRRHSFGSRIKQKRALSFKRVCRGRIGSGYYRFGDRCDLYDSLFCGTEPDGIKNLNFQIKRQAFYACLFIMIKNNRKYYFVIVGKDRMPRQNSCTKETNHKIQSGTVCFFKIGVIYFLQEEGSRKERIVLSPKGDTYDAAKLFGKRLAE